MIICTNHICMRGSSTAAAAASAVAVAAMVHTRRMRYNRLGCACRYGKNTPHAAAEAEAATEADGLLTRPDSTPHAVG